MQIIDFSALDVIPGRDRIDAISLVADGMESRHNQPFGIAVGDRLIYVGADESGIVRISLVGLLHLELGSIDQCLIELPADARLWDDAMREYLAWSGARSADEDTDPLAMPGDQLRQIHALRRDIPASDIIKVMIGRSGLAILAEEGTRFALSYRSFSDMETEQRHRKMGISDCDPGAELLEIFNGCPNDQLVEARLKQHETPTADEIAEYGTRYYLSLLCLERARLRQLIVADPREAAMAASHLIMARR